MSSSLHVSAFGDPENPPVFFLHGFMGSGQDWAETADLLTDSFHCLLVDLPGHGKTGPMDNDQLYTVPGCAKAVIETIEANNINSEVGAMARAGVVGYSMGGRIALYISIYHPEKCKAVITESASPGLIHENDRESRAESDERWAAVFEQRGITEAVGEWYAQPLFSSLRARQELYSRIVSRRCRNNPKEMARVMRGMSIAGQESLWNSLPDLSIPVLAISGGMDRKYIRVAGEMAGLSPMIQTAIVSGAGHNAHMEDPEAVAGYTRSFFKKIMR